jgi:hypothetical protein
LTATGTAGAVAYVAWAALDGVRTARRRRTVRAQALAAGYTR